MIKDYSRSRGNYFAHRWLCNHTTQYLRYTGVLVASFWECWSPLAVARSSARDNVILNFERTIDDGGKTGFVCPPVAVSVGMRHAACGSPHGSSGLPFKREVSCERKLWKLNPRSQQILSCSIDRFLEFAWLCTDFEWEQQHRETREASSVALF